MYFPTSKSLDDRMVGQVDDWTTHPPQMLETSVLIGRYKGWTALRKFIPYESDFGRFRATQEALKRSAEEVSNAAS
jgi:hypothetical protein